MNAVARFWVKVDQTAGLFGCWSWTGSVDRKGYGHLKRGGVLKPAHRVAYELLVGPIPDGLQLDHLCRNRACVNPVHLDPVDGRTNTLRGNGRAALNARKTVCPQGHEYDVVTKGLRNSVARRCGRCRREQSVRRAHRAAA